MIVVNKRRAQVEAVTLDPSSLGYIFKRAVLFVVQQETRPLRAATKSVEPSLS